MLLGLFAGRVEAHFSIPARADGLNLTLEVVSPEAIEGEASDVHLKAGSHRITLYVLDAEYRPVEGADVRLRFSPPSGAGITEQRLAPLGQGAYRAEGSFFTQPGSWQVEAVLQLQNRAAPITAQFPVQIAPFAAQSSGLSVWAMAGSLLIAISGAGVVLWWIRRRRGATVNGSL